MELKGLVQNTQYSVEVEGVIREVLSDILLRASSQDRHLHDSVDAVLEEWERWASGEVGVCGRVEGGHGVRGCRLGKDG
jgi:hypothetical protein